MHSVESSPIATAAPSALATRIRVTYQDSSTPWAPAPRHNHQVDGTAARRKLALMKRGGLFGSDTMGATIERACTAEDLCDAYRLVHEVYLETGYIKPEPSGMRLRIFETSSETATFIAKHEGRVVGVISVVGDSLDLGLPSDCAFSEELDGLRGTGIKICEVTNQVVSSAFRKSAVTTELMRCAVAHSLQSGFRMGVVAVSPSHNAFYDLLGFTELGSERSYSTKVHDPVVALALDFDEYRHMPAGLTEAEEFVRLFLGRDNPYLPEMSAWDRRARARFFNPELLAEIFVGRSNFLAECSAAELDVVRLRWGQELFRAVVDGATAEAQCWVDTSEEARPHRAMRSGAAPERSPGAGYIRDTSPRFSELDFTFGGDQQRSHAAAESASAVRAVAAWWTWIRTVLTTAEYRRMAMGN